MAGDWIKMRVDLQTHPKIVRILSATQADKFRVIGGLHAVWSVFDTHSVDGKLNGYTAATLDHVIGWQGFAQAMIDVGWLIEDDAQALVLPEFFEHNGKSGKRRAEDQKRKREDRKSPQPVRILSASEPDKKLTRDREDIEVINTPIPPKGRKSAITFPQFLLNCKANNETPIPDEHPVFAYADEAKIPRDFLALHWFEFKDRYGDGSKKYKDWRKVFSNSVRGNWFRLWYAPKDGGEYQLTTDGVQAQNVHRDKLK